MFCMAANAGAQPNPSIVFEMLSRYQHSAALKGAIELDIFTHIADGAVTAAEIAARAKASEKGVRVLCDFLTIQGLLTKQGKDYGLTPTAGAFLNQHSPAYMGSAAKFLLHPDVAGYFQDMATVVRNGGASSKATVSADNPVWVEFAKSMVPIVAMTSKIVAGIVARPGQKIKVLDVAAGHGLFGIAIAQANPAAEIVALDWANVLDVAEENAQKMGVADRFSTIVGDAFTVDLGSGYDLVLLPNFLHHFSMEENVTLLKRMRGAMKAGGRVATVEFVPNEDRVTPPMSAGFAMQMLGGTPHGDAYTFSEYQKMFGDAGFGASTLHELEPTPERLVLTSY
jgi:2-polyprenyl-3-methyl-5-hydroxy-6-metoxy-1,4-benzoquinol methylase